MATRTLRVAMEGVTGRLGTNQHLIRSVLAIRNEGGLPLRNGDRAHARAGSCRPQPGQAVGACRSARRTGVVGRPGCDARRQDHRHLLRCRGDGRAAGPRAAGDRGRQAHLSGEADRGLGRRGDDDRARRAGRGRQGRRRAGQGLPAGLPEAAEGARLRLLRPHPLGAARGRLVGVRRRSLSDAALELELPQDRTAAGWCSICIRTGATCWRA